VARVHLRSLHGCPKCSYEASAKIKRKSEEDFIKEANKVHNNFYDYSKTHYTGDSKKVTITCPLHGDFKQAAGSHIGKSKCGCRLCGNISSNIKQKLTLSSLEAIPLPENININFQEYYNYKGALIGSCSLHGNFTTTLAVIKRGEYICPSCANLHRGWNRSLYTNKPTTLYLLELSNGTFKYGITQSLNVWSRYGRKDSGVIKEILYQVTLLNGEDAYDIEKTIGKRFKDFKYKGVSPLSCTGSTEILTINPIEEIKELINEYSRVQ
jgi:hypothetical protein